MEASPLADRLPDGLRRAEPFLRHVVATLLSGLSVGGLLAILGGLLPVAGIEIETGVYWRFGIATSLVAGNLMALVMARQERHEG